MAQPWNPKKRSPFADRQVACGAIFGNVEGWEIALHFPIQEPTTGASSSASNCENGRVYVADLSVPVKIAFHGQDARSAAAGAVGAPPLAGAKPGTVFVLQAEQSDPTSAVKNYAQALACVFTERYVLIIGNHTGPAPHGAEAAQEQARVPVLQQIQSVAGYAAYRVDRSGGLASLALIGTSAPAILQRLTTIDVHPQAFSEWRCAQTAVAQVPGIIIHRAKQEYHLHVSRSDAQHLWDAVFDAGAGFGIEPMGWEAYLKRSNGP